MTQPDDFAGHNIYLETERLILRPFKDADFDIAIPFYNDPDFLQAMEDEPPDEPITRDYLKSAGEYMRKDGFLFAIVEKASGRTIGEVCLQWMNLERGKIEGEKIMRLPIGIWDKTYGVKATEKRSCGAWWRTPLRNWELIGSVRWMSGQTMSLQKRCGSRLDSPFHERWTTGKRWTSR